MPGTGEQMSMPGAPESERRAGADRRRLTRVRMAAVGDLHCGEMDVGTYREHFSLVSEDADVLMLAGDLTRRGTEAEFRTIVGELADVTIPIVAVLGNHDYESNLVSEGTAILRGRGIHVLCGDTFRLNDACSIAGVKGYMGGFGRGMLTAFGESETKVFVQATIDEVHRLELALRQLDTPIRVALLHYAPVAGTVEGEPESIGCFLGTDRFAEPLDRYAATVAFHGHAHTGSFRGQTLGGVPVFNVSLPVIRRDGIGPLYYVHEVPVPPPGSVQVPELISVT